VGLYQSGVEFMSNPISLRNTAILDTETTGLGDDAEICEISVICGETGGELLDTLVKPSKPIPEDAIRIHGITNEMVENAPCFDSVLIDLVGILRERHLIIYNADYDLRLIEQSRSSEDTAVKALSCICAMHWYSEFWGEPSYRGDGYRWQRLGNAARQMGVDLSDIELHRAKADCEVTRRVIIAANEAIGKAELNL
jgi:DNA polymerase-3 subunit epsilon